MKRRLLSILLTLALCLTLLPAAALAEGSTGDPSLVAGFYFETDPAEEGWTFVDADGDGGNWEWKPESQSTSYGAYEGSGYLSSKWNSDGSVDNWAISPAVTLPALSSGSSLELSLYVEKNSTTWTEYFRFYVGTSPVPGEMTCLSGPDDLVANNSYTRYTADLSAYAGQAVYIAVRHCTGIDTFRLFLDNVEIRSVTSYDLWIAGTQVTSLNAADLSVIDGVTGTASFDPDTNTLTLEDATITYASNGGVTIASSLSDLTIAFSGTNTISAPTSGSTRRAVDTYWGGTETLTLSGADDAAALTVQTTAGGASENGAIRGYRLVVTGGTVTCAAPEEAYGRPSHIPYAISLNGSSGLLTVTGGKLVCKGWAPLAFAVTEGGTVDSATVLRGSAVYDGSALEAYDYDNNGGFVSSGWQNTYRYVEATAGAVPYDLYVAGVQVTSANAADLSVIDGVTGAASYDADTNTLHLDGATIVDPATDPSSTTATQADAAIAYTGNDDFTVAATGENTVFGANTERGQSIALLIGDPDDVYSNYAGQQTAAVTVDVAEGATLTLAGGKGGSYYPSSYGLCSMSLGRVTVTGDGNLYAYGGNTTYSYGILTLGGLTIDGAGAVTAVGGSGYYSCGICEDSGFMIADRGLILTGSGTVTASGGTATYQSLGIYCGGRQGLLIDTAEGQVIAAGRAPAGAYGILSEHGVTVEDGDVIAYGEVSEGGSGDVCFGICQNGDEDITINGGSVTALTNSGSDEASALNKAPVLGEGITAGGSVNADGSGAVVYVADDNATYKWFQAPFTAPVTVTLNVRCSNGAGGTVAYAWDTVPSATQVEMTENGTIDLVRPDGATTLTVTATPAEGYYLNQSQLEDGTGTYTDQAALAAALLEGAVFPATEDATIRIEFDNHDGTGGEEPAPAPTAYTVTVEETEHGTVTADRETAPAGVPVTLTAIPDEGYALRSLTVTDADGAAVTVNETDGGGSFTMPAADVTVKAVFAAEGGAGLPFEDVNENDWFYDAVAWAYPDITTGTTETTFSPYDTCTRAQTVTFLWRAAGSPEPTGTENPFDDVKEDAYYYKAVLWAVENGITTGVSETAFDPDGTVTRAQTAAFLYRYLQSRGGGFTGLWAFPLDYADADQVPEYAYEAFCYLTMEGVMQGSDGMLTPLDDCLRGQIVTMLWRCFER